MKQYPILWGTVQSKRKGQGVLQVVHCLNIALQTTGEYWVMEEDKDKNKDKDEDKDKQSCTPNAWCGWTKGHSRETCTSGFGELPLAALAVSSHSQVFAGRCDKRMVDGEHL